MQVKPIFVPASQILLGTLVPKFTTFRPIMFTLSDTTKKADALFYKEHPLAFTNGAVERI